MRTEAEIRKELKTLEQKPLKFWNLWNLGDVIEYLNWVLDKDLDLDKDGKDFEEILDAPGINMNQMEYCSKIPPSSGQMGFWWVNTHEFVIYIDADGTIDIRGLGGPYACKGGQRFYEKHDLLKRKKFWISWWHNPKLVFELSRPWWTSGEGPQGASICAAIIATNETHAKEIIRSAYKKSVSLEFHFCELQKAIWSPFSSRFPRAAWMDWME